MTRTADALSLPLIAYRGLWDKFAPPLSEAAVRRSYLRGVPSLVRCANAEGATRALAMASDTTVNRRRQPIFLVVDTLPWAAIPRLRVDESVSVYAIDGSDPIDTTNTIYQWNDGTWRAAGSYVSISAASRIESLDSEIDQHSLVIFESTNVVGDVRESASLPSLNDDRIVEALQRMAPADANVLRVSDLVEFDWLRRQMREAA